MKSHTVHYTLPILTQKGKPLKCNQNDIGSSTIKCLKKKFAEGTFATRFETKFFLACCTTVIDKQMKTD